MKYCYKKLLFAALVLTAEILMLSVNTSFAEGSKDLYPSGATGRRAYLLSRLYTQTAAAFCPLPTAGTHKVWVQTGDTIYVGQSMQGKTIGALTGTINLRTPNGTTYTSGTSTTVGLIANRAEELNGPDRPGYTSGYTPFTRVVLAAEAGVWEIDFVSCEPAAGGGTNLTQAACPGHLFDNDFPADTAWSGTGLGGQPIVTGSSALILAWDVSVGNGGALKTGRVYTNILTRTLPNNYPTIGGVYSTLYVLTNDGYSYRIKENGLNGASWSIFSNDRGITTGGTSRGNGYSGGTPSYQSEDNSNLIPLSVTDPRRQDTLDEYTNKIFYNKPASNLPATAPTRYAPFTANTTTWLKTPVVSPLVSGLTITGKEIGLANTVGPDGANITFTSNVAGSYAVDIDVNNNTLYTDAVDRRLTGVAVVGSNVVAWDGKDGTGAYLTNNPTIKVKASINVGEVHFPMSDVEVNPFGIIIQRLDNNYDTVAGQDIVFWNDVNITNHNTNVVSTPSVPFTNVVDGLSSLANGHKWGAEMTVAPWEGCNCDSSASCSTTLNDGNGKEDFGNGKVLDTWAYVAGSELITQTVNTIHVDLAVTSITPSAASVSLGSSLTYTIVVTNPANATSYGVTNAPFLFTAPAGFTITSAVYTATSGTSSESGALNLGDSLSSNLTMAAGSVGTYVITGTVGAPLISGNTIAASASILRTGDVWDDDATSAGLAGVPNNALTECNGAPTGAGCNNIKTASTVTITPPATVSLSISKASTAGTYNPGSTKTYTVTVTNTGTSNAVAATLTDALPSGITYVAQSTSATFVNPGNTVRDEFNSQVYTANNGTKNWVGNWTEAGDSPNGSATTGNVTVATNTTSFWLFFNGAGTTTITRGVDLSLASGSPSLTFDWRTNGLTAGQTLRVQLSSDGSSFTDVGTAISGTTTGTFSFTVPNTYFTANAAVRFVRSATAWTAGDFAYVDNVQISYTSTETRTNAPLGTLNSGLPATLITAADAITLTPGGTMTVTFNALIGCASSTPLVNTATANCTGLATPVSATASNPYADAVLPTISCPANVAQNVISGCSRSLAITDPTYSDNCAVTTLTWATTGATTLSSGATGINVLGTQTFNVGVTTVTYTAKDAANNQATCSFTVTITDNISPTITCPANISQNVVSGCSRSIVVTDPTYSDNCAVTTLTWATTGATTLSSGATGINVLGTQTFNVGVTTVTYTAKDAANNQATCSFTVTVIDNILPTITCPSNIVRAAGAACTASVTPSNPTTGDNCAVTTLTWAITGVTTGSSAATGINNLGATVFNKGVSTVTYTVKDAANNQATCSFTVTINDSTAPSFTSCPSTINATSVAGSCNVSVSTPNPTVTDNCPGTPSLTWVMAGATSGSGSGNAGTQTFSPGATTITYTATDASGNTATCAFTVNVDPCADLVTVKTRTSATATPNVGNTVQFTITVTNNGPDEAAAVTLTDLLPAGLTLTGNTPSAGTYNTGTGVWNGFSMLPGTSRTLILTCTVNAGQEGNTITNTTTKATSVEHDPTDVGNDLTETVIVNDVPIAVNDVNTTNEDTPVSGTAQSNDTPSDNNPNTWTLVGGNGGASNGTVTMGSNGTYTYTPNANFNGTDVFTYQVCDVTPDCSTATVTVTVNPVNDVPVAVNDVNSTNEDTPVSGSANTNDTPSGDGGNTWSLVGGNGGASNGTVTMGSNGTYTYTPNANFNGTDVFIYQVCDVTPDCSTATVTVTVNPVNDVPVAVNDVNTTNEDTPVSGSANTNDTPSGDGGNTWSLVGGNGGASNGTVTMNPDGTYTYTPNANFNGTDVFTYTLCDVDNSCSTATVTITVDPVNDLPVAVNDVNTTNEDTPVSGSANTNDTPSGDGGNTWTLVGANGGASNGTVTMNPDGTYTYTPNANFNGTDVFTYTLCDVDNSCSTATVTITVDPVNDVPVAVNDVNTTNEDTPVSGSANTNDTPSGDGGNTWTLVGANGGASNGTVTMNPDGTYTYTPNANFNGTDVFTYTLCDVDNSCSTATVTITVDPVNDVPVAVNDVNTTNEDTPVSGSANTNDTPSGDGGNTWTLVGANGGASNGTVTMNPDGTYTYTPNANFNGTDVFTYTLCDVDNSCSTATVTITINPVNDVPVAVNDVNTTNEDTPVSGSANTNDTPSGDGGNTWTLVGANGGASNGTVTMNPDGTYTYTPNANFNGTDVFTYTLCDVDNSCSTATVTITINPVNDVPVAVNDVNTTNEDTPVSGSANTNDTPSGDGGNTWTLVGANGGASNGTVTMNPDGTYTYTPNANFNGTDVFTYTLCDVDNSCSTATVTITVDPVNDVPVAVNDVNTTNEDTPVSGSANTNDTPSGDGGNTWTLVGANGGASNGTVTMNPDGTYTYTPNANFNGTDVFTYTLCDVDNSCSTATVTITVDPVNDVPVAVNDVNTTIEDTPVSGNASNNDTPSGDGGNTWTLVGANGGASNGTVTMNPDGTYTYTPSLNFNGTDVFTYQVCDINNDCSTATVTITVNSVNNFPTAVNDLNTTNEDTPVTGSSSTNDTPSGDGGNVWTLIGVNGGAANGTVSMDVNGTYTYTPNANFNGTDVFTYQVCDITPDCSTATVTITINPVNDVPVAVNDVNTTNEDTPVSGSANTNDTPSGDGGNTWTLVGANGGASNGTVTMNPDGTYTYTPNANFNGTDVFTYTLCDVDNDCSTATVTVTVNPVDDVPVAVNDVNTTNEDTPVSGSANTNDTPSGDGGNTWTLVGANGGASNGTVTMNPDGTYTYTPSLNFNGTDVFTYQVCDINNDCSTATVTITVNSVNNFPTAVNDLNTTNEDTPVIGSSSTNDTPSGDGGNVWTLIGANGGASNGSVTMGTNGTYTYTPNANFNGTDVFTYQVCDITPDCSTATVTITINPVDDLPVAVNDVNTTNEDTPVSGSANTNDTPSGDGGNTWTLVGGNGGASNGTVTMNPDGTYTYTPNGNFNGTDVFTYTLCDADNDCSTATVTVTVNPVDDLPVAVNDVNTTNEDTPVSGSANTNDTPSGDGGNTWTLVGGNGGASNGTVTMNPDGTYTYTPNGNFNGTDVFTYTLCDADNDCSTATVTVTVNPVDDLPVAVNDVNTTNEDTPVSGSANTNDTPSGDGGNTWTLVGGNGGASNGTVTMNPDGTYTYTPNANFNGTDVFTYTLCDADNDCSTATVTVTVNPVNDVPVAVNDVNTTIEDTPVSGSAQGNDTPSGDGGNTWTLVGGNGGASNGTVTMNPDGTYTYTPNANFNGTDVFTYTLCDADNDCSTATVTITVNSVNNFPTAVNDLNTTNEDTPVIGSSSTNDTPSGDGGNVWTLIGANGGASNDP